LSREIRQNLDGNEQFLSGHRIVEARKRKRIYDCTWALDDKKIQVLLLQSFPKLKTNLLQRRRASRWLRIIQLYFKMHYTGRQTAEEMDESIQAIHGTIRSIHRAISNCRAGDSGVRVGKLGRPKKVVP
jgi:hypothetical protein